MIHAVRSFFRDTEASIAATVGIVGGLVLFYLFSGIASGLVQPILRRRLTNGSSPNGLEFTVLNVTFNYQQFLVNLIALLLLAAVAYMLFVWHRNEEERDEGATTRDCPACKSEISIDATRCAFCTSVVPPIEDRVSEPRGG